MLRWVVDRVAPGASGFVRFVAAVSPGPPPGGLIANAASATQAFDDGGADSNTVMTAVGAALSAEVSAGPSVVNVGQPFLVTLTVTNTGCAVASAPSVGGGPAASGTGAAVV